MSTQQATGRYVFDGDAQEIAERIEHIYTQEEKVPMSVARETPKLEEMTLIALAVERERVTALVRDAAHSLAVAQERYAAAVNRLHHVDAESSRRKLAAAGIVLRQYH